MKKALMLISFGFLLVGIARAQNSSATITAPVATNNNTGTKQDVLALKESTFNFGKIPQGRPATHNFEIVNTGKEPLRLDNVQASCGCTTPEWSKEAIPAGGSANIKVGYNAYGEGGFTKTVTIFYGGQTKAL